MNAKRAIRAKALVTDHALIRHLERSLGIDMDALRVEVLDIVEDGIARGASAVRSNGRAYVIEGGRCITVYPQGAWLDHVTRRAPRAGKRPPSKARAAPAAEDRRPA